MMNTSLKLCLAVALVSTTSLAFADYEMRCESDEGRYRSCEMKREGRVALDRQLSDARCERGQTWGVERGAIWVDRGCRGVFRVDTDGPGYGRPERVPDWAVGRFQLEGGPARLPDRLWISEDGRVGGEDRGQRIEGYFRRGRLVLGSSEFEIRPAGNGFVAYEPERHFEVRYLRR